MELTSEQPGIGQKFQVEMTVTQRMINDFAQVTGDTNPIHIDPNFARSSIFGKCIADGCLIAGRISALVAASIPGCVARTVNLQFKRPVHVDSEILLQIEIVSFGKHGINLNARCILVSTQKDAITGNIEVVLP